MPFEFTSKSRIQQSHFDNIYENRNYDGFRNMGETLLDRAAKSLDNGFKLHTSMLSDDIIRMAADFHPTVY